MCIVGNNQQGLQQFGQLGAPSGNLNLLGGLQALALRRRGVSSEQLISAAGGSLTNPKTGQTTGSSAPVRQSNLNRSGASLLGGGGR